MECDFAKRFVYTLEALKWYGGHVSACTDMRARYVGLGYKLVHLTKKLKEYLMNKIVANIFGEILSVIHIAVIIGFGAAIVKYESDKSAIGNIFGYFAYNGNFYGVLFVIFVLYFLFAGVLSILVAINEQLEGINKIHTLMVFRELQQCKTKST
jgi:hypothetical protein